MDSQVQRDDDPRDGGAAKELCIAENRSRAMVVAVQEGWRRAEVSMVLTRCRGRILSPRTQRLLLEEQEDGVEELKVFGQVVQLQDRVSFQWFERRSSRAHAGPRHT